MFVIVEHSIAPNGLARSRRGTQVIPEVSSKILDAEIAGPGKREVPYNCEHLF